VDSTRARRTRFQQQNKKQNNGTKIKRTKRLQNIEQ